jgi:hypothetical protein
MTAAEQEPGDAPHAPEVIRPGPGAKDPLNVAADAQGKKDKPPSVTVRYEVRVDSYIAELRRDKQRLEEEVQWLRIQEIHHLREDARWLEDLASWQSQELAKTRTSYASAIAFSWFSFALIAVGGCLVSYATFVHPENQRVIATAALVGLFTGVAVQGFNSLVGTRLFLGKTDPPGAGTRPQPNPQVVNSSDVHRTH